MHPVGASDLLDNESSSPELWSYHGRAEDVATMTMQQAGPHHAAQQVDPDPDVGEALRARREALGWSLDEVAEWLRIKLAYLQALEEGRPQDLPGSTYALGFLRSYASGLGLDAQALARQFRDETKLVARPDLSFPAPVPERGVPAGAAVLLGVVLLGAAYTGWYMFGGHERLPTQTVPPPPQSLASPALPPGAATQSPPVQVQPVQVQPVQAQPVRAQPAAPAPVAVPLAPPASAPPAPAPATIAIKASAASWVQIRRQDGTVLYEHILQPGESWSTPADGATLLLSTGNAGAITLSAGGATTQALGRPGMVRRNLRLSVDAVRDGSLLAAAPGQTSPFLAGSGPKQVPAKLPAHPDAGQDQGGPDDAAQSDREQ